MKLPSTDILNKIYGESQESGARYASLADHYREIFGSEEMEFFTSPGRTEIIGNHTDHNGGKIIAASIDMDTIGAAYPNGTNVIQIVSEGYRDRVVVDLDRLDKAEKNHGTLSLVAGMMEAAGKWGFKTGGFNAYVSTQVIGAAGVSSSASFEMLVCSIINYFFNEGRMRYIDYARVGQYAENHFWSKGSGLMDQMACAVGGAIMLDFSKPDDELCKKVDFSFEQFGYHFVIVNTGKGHANLSAEYSSVPNEMKEAAAVMGKELLCEADLETLLEYVPQMKNDRAVLRAMHFYTENKRVERMGEAIRNNDGATLLKMIGESGRSSFEWLQNCYTVQDCSEQKIPLTLALTQLFLDEIGDGSCRIHGGGFAGVIMAVVPEKELEHYVAYISRYVGRENVYPMKIRSCGAVHLDK